MNALKTICVKYEALFQVSCVQCVSMCSSLLCVKISAVPYVMGLRNAPSGPDHLNEDLSFWTFHVNICPPLLQANRKKYAAGFELLSEPQRDFDTVTVGESRLTRPRHALTGRTTHSRRLLTKSVDEYNSGSLNSITHF